MNTDLEIQQKAWSFMASVFNDLPDEGFVGRMRETPHESARWLDGLTDKEALTLLGRDRARLLRCVDAHCITPPYESLYMGKDENETLNELHEFFLEAGFAPTGVYREPADYVGMELAFLAECCTRELKAIEAGDEQESKRLSLVREAFTEKHACSWIPLYAENMLDAAQTGFYENIAELLLSIFSRGERA